MIRYTASFIFHESPLRRKMYQEIKDSYSQGTCPHCGERGLVVEERNLDLLGRWEYIAYHKDPEIEAACATLQKITEGPSL